MSDRRIAKTYIVPYEVSIPNMPDYMCWVDCLIGKRLITRVYKNAKNLKEARTKINNIKSKWIKGIGI
jgi:hypothetical protein